MRSWFFVAGLLAALLVVVLLVRGRGSSATPESTADPHGETAVTLIDQAGGDAGFTYAVAVDDGRAVFGRGRDLVVADVSNPASPAGLRSVTLGGDVRDLAMAGGLAFAAADTAGLQIVDVERGLVVGTIRFEDRAYGVAVEGTRVFVAARSQGLRVVDASNPATPREIGHLVTPDEAVGVVLRGDLAYVAAWYESMRVVDVSDPSAPVEVGFAPYDSYDHGAVWAVGVDGDLALAAIPERGIRAINVTDPRAITNHGFHRFLRAPADVALRGSIAYIADQDAGLRVVDLSKPVEAVEIGSLPLPGRAMSVRLAGDLAYVAAKEAGVRIVDVSLPHAPREIGFLDPDDAILDVVSAGGVLLAAGAENGVYRYNAPGRLVRQYGTRSSRIGVDGNRVVTAGAGGVRYYEDGELRGEAPGETHSIAIAGGIVAAAGPLGMRFFEAPSGGPLKETAHVSPEWQKEVGHLFRTPPAAWDVLLRDSLAYAAFDNGIHVINLTDPAQPTIVAHLPTPQRAYRLSLTANRLLAACDDGLRSIDVTDSRRPVEIAYLKTPSFATALLVEGDVAYVGDLSGMVTATRVEDLGRIGSWKVAERVLGLARVEGGMAVAAGREGVRVVSVGPDDQFSTNAP